MQIEIKNFRGCQSANFDLHTITMIGGRNAAGKSSIAQATAALLTGNPLPVRGVTKTGAGQLVRSGGASGSAMLETDDGDPTGHETGSTTINWPKAAVTTTGIPPSASDFAAGLNCILKLNQKDRAAALANYLDAEPNREDYDAALKSLNLPDELLDQLWKVIRETGWDGAHQNCKEKGARLKGQWENITSDRYGSKKAENWLPEGWEPELDGLSEEALQADLNDARQVLEAAIASDAVDESKRAELEESAGGIIGLKEQIAILKEELCDAEVIREASWKKLKALPMPGQSDALECPECKAKIELYDGKLRPVTLLSDDEISARRDAVDSMTVEVKDLTGQVQGIQEKLNEAQQQFKTAQRAGEELQNMGQPGSDNAETCADVDQSRTQVQHAEARLSAFQKKHQADNRHSNISLNAELIKALAPDGIRQRKLAGALAEANKGMADLSRVSGFGVVELDAGLEASLNGTPYQLLSKSERWRVRVTLQLWMAKEDKSAAVIVDGADVLVDRPLRNGLIGALQGLKIPALVTMALPEVDAPKFGLPDLSLAGIGQSYWIEDGVLMTRHDATAGRK